MVDTCRRMEVSFCALGRGLNLKSSESVVCDDNKTNQPRSFVESWTQRVLIVDFVSGYRRVIGSQSSGKGCVRMATRNAASHRGILMTKKALLVLFCCLVFPICPLLYGQASGSFSGTVTDKTGSVVSGASVKATSQGTGFFRESKTDDSGHYLMPIMPIGDYTIRVESAGFGPAEQKDVRLQVDEHRELDFSLTPASVTSTVEVSATEVAVQTTNPTLGQVITSQQVAQLPLEWPRLRAAGHAHSWNDSGDQPQQLLQRRSQQRSFHSRIVLTVGRRIARSEYGLAVRRQ